MTKRIKCRGLRLLAGGEFAIRDKRFGWRFLKQSAEDRFPQELARTLKRRALVLIGRRRLRLYQMPNSFKTGFMLAFYGVSLTYEPCRNNLHALLRLMGFKLGGRALSKGKQSSPLGGLQLQPFWDNRVDGGWFPGRKPATGAAIDPEEICGGRSSAATLAEQS